MQELERKDATENENSELSDNDPIEEVVDDEMEVDGSENPHPTSISFLETSHHFESFQCFGKSIGASSQDLDLEHSFHQIQLSKVRSQPTITRFFSNWKPEVRDEDRDEKEMLM